MEIRIFLLPSSSSCRWFGASMWNYHLRINCSRDKVPHNRHSMARFSESPSAFVTAPPNLREIILFPNPEAWWNGQIHGSVDCLGSFALSLRLLRRLSQLWQPTRPLISRGTKPIFAFTTYYSPSLPLPVSSFRLTPHLFQLCGLPSPDTSAFNHPPLLVHRSRCSHLHKFVLFVTFVVWCALLHL